MESTIVPFSGGMVLRIPNIEIQIDFITQALKHLSYFFSIMSKVAVWEKQTVFTKQNSVQPMMAELVL